MHATPPSDARAATTGPAADFPFAELKARQHAAWSCGDYAVIGTTLQLVGERLCETLDLHAKERVLDVAAGNGNASLAAARCGCAVTSTDYVEALLERARERAAAERLPIEFRVADAEQLPFADGAFDVVVSTFGVMFTPDQDRAAAELLRVCRSGGRIGLASWTPDGFLGELFRVIGRFVPPPAGQRSPAAWGTPGRLDELFRGPAAGAAAIGMQLRQFVFRYRSPQHWLDVFRSLYGPMVKAFAALGPAERSRLEQDLLLLVGRRNRARDDSMVVPSDYLEVVITRR